MTNKELLKYVPTTKELANEYTFNRYEEMNTELEGLQAEFGKELDILNDIMIVSGGRFLVEDQGMTPEEADGYGLVYTIDDVSWSGILDQLLIEWYTDEDYSSGLFEDFTTDTLSKLKAMNNLMYKIGGEWDYNTAVDHMKAIEKRYNKTLPAIIKVVSAYDFNPVIEDWLAGNMPTMNFINILETIEEQEGRLERQEIAGAIVDLSEETGLTYNEASNELNSFNGVTFIY